MGGESIGENQGGVTDRNPAGDGGPRKGGSGRKGGISWGGVPPHPPGNTGTTIPGVRNKKEGGEEGSGGGKTSPIGSPPGKGAGHRSEYKKLRGGVLQHRRKLAEYPSRGIDLDSRKSFQVENLVGSV